VYYGVFFPDFQAAITTGLTLGEACEMAEEALAFHVQGLIEDGEALLEASTLESVMADPANRYGVTILVSLRSPAPKAVRINVTLPDDILSRIDAYARGKRTIPLRLPCPRRPPRNRAGKRRLTGAYRNQPVERPLAHSCRPLRAAISAIAWKS
jgi:predicted RNase H-like HicB family nuclease